MADPPHRPLARYESTAEELRTGTAAAQAAQVWPLLVACAAAIVFVVLSVSALRHTIPAWYPPLALPVALVSIRRYRRHRRTALRYSRLVSFYERGLRRLREEWAGAGENGESFWVPGHVYERDLNVLGPGSLFELLCTARTHIGRARLAQYFLELPRITESRARQEAVKELAPAIELREKMHLLGRYDFEGIEWGDLNTWLDELPVRCPGPIRAGMAAVSTLILGLVLAVFAGPVTPASAMPFLGGLAAVQLFLAARWTRRTRPVWERVRRFGSDIGVLREGLELLPREKFASPKLRQLRDAAEKGAIPALRRLERLVQAIYECDKEWFYGPSRVLLLHEQIALAVERWKAAHGADLRNWADAWAEFEALNSLGGYAYEHPRDVFPHLVDEGPHLLATGVGHPLLPEEGCIRNDICLTPDHRFYLVSGSNMAGKSTFLRAIGTNVLLALIGAPIRAHSAELSAFSVCASIAAVDSLLDGRSRFLAEVERLRETLRRTADDTPVLFLFDEFFSGTNSTDRRLVADGVVRELVAAGAVGALSTHDLALTEIALEGDLRGTNVHFASDGSGDPLCFDYRLKQGICAESSALAILRLAGIEPGSGNPRPSAGPPPS